VTKASQRASRRTQTATAPRPQPLRDRVGPELKALFVGINPGIRSATIGHHFAGYSNRFWSLLFDAGLVPERITCEQDDRLPKWGFGLTNLIARPTSGVGELLSQEYIAGHTVLLKKVRRLRPRVVALVGVTLARMLLVIPSSERVRLGLQPVRLASLPVFVLPNPSGRNAHYSYGEMLAAFRALKAYLGQDDVETAIS